MCATVVVEDVDPRAPKWDRDRVALIIGEGLTHTEALHQIRALLTFLGVPQHSLGATCWCGEHVSVPPAEKRVPRQRSAPGPKGIRHAS